MTNELHMVDAQPDPECPICLNPMLKGETVILDFFEFLTV